MNNLGPEAFPDGGGWRVGGGRHDTVGKLLKRRQQKGVDKEYQGLTAAARCLNDCDNNKSIKEETRQEVGVYRSAQVSSRLSFGNSTPERQEWAQETVYFWRDLSPPPPPREQQHQTRSRVQSSRLNVTPLRRSAR